MHIEARTAVLDSGVALSYAERGDQAGLPLVLLPGYADSWRSWVPVLEALPASIRAIAVSQRGHGDSAKPRGRYDTAAFTDDLACLMDRLAIDRAMIAGHSLGSLVAQRFAMERPDRTRGLILLGAFRTLRGNREVAALWDESVAALADPVDPGFVRAFQQSTLSGLVPSAFLATVVAESLKVPAHVWRAALRALLDEDSSDGLGRIAPPTLVLWGDRDALATRREQEALIAAIRGATMTTYPGAGHGLHWEEPARAAADIAAFVARIAATSCSASAGAS